MKDAIDRNSLRGGNEQVSTIGIRATHKKLLPPSLSEGFDQFYQVKIQEG